MPANSNPASTSRSNSGGDEDDNWVNVTWMPHASLSQTSHVCLLIRSAHVSLDELEFCKKANREEWKVQVTIRGIGGIALVPFFLIQTPNSEVGPRDETTSSSEVPLYPSVLKATHICQWDHFLQIPFRWRDLPRDSYLQFQIVGHTGVVQYEACMPFFNEYGRLSTGLMRLELQAQQPSSLPHDATSDGNHSNMYQQPGNLRQQKGFAATDPPPMLQEDDPVWKASGILDQLQRFQDSSSRQGSSLSATTTTAATATAIDSRKATHGSVASVPWLDAITKEHCLKVIQDAAKHQGRFFTDTVTMDSSPTAYLILELPVFDVPIMHEETFYPIPQHGGASGAVTPLGLSVYTKKTMQPGGKKSVICGNGSDTSQNLFSHPYTLVKFLDYENEMDNPVEDKYRTLAHDLLRGLVDPALKPDREQRDRLAAIIASPSHHPTREEKDLLWRFRFSLVDNRRALAKFLLAVDWTVESEVVQAAELLEQWRRRSPIEVTDALKLLGKHVAFQTNLVRAYAIDTLAAAPDTELRLYLLQLVQALKYETSNNLGGPSSSSNASRSAGSSSSSSSVSSLAAFLIARAAGNMQLASYLYWYLKVELHDPTHGARYKEVFAALKSRLSDTVYRRAGFPEFQTNNLDSMTDSVSATANSFKSIVVDSVSKLSSSLRGSDNHPIHPGSGNATSSMNTVGRSSHRQKSFWDILVAQDHFISGLMDLQMRCRDTRGRKDVKEAQFIELLSKEGYDKNAHRDAVPLPSAPHLIVNGVKPDTAKMFKSALYPALVEFHVEADLGDTGPGTDGSRTPARSEKKKNSKKKKASSSSSSSNSSTSSSGVDHLSHYRVIVKTGDDLRQDQLVIMMIQLMDGLLKRAALDLCLSPYSIIAMSPTSGLVEFVSGSIPISQILSNHNGSILQFFQSCAPQQGAKYNVRPDVISTYVRSCAGYCVITYLLAVGDRHLDNILMDKDGHFFHIDFGFIFGRDPKPLPPAFRLTREMVEGMGGLDSIEYRQFCSLACQAFNALRKSAGLVLNLLHLMSDAGIEDLSNNPSADAEGVIAKVEERFRLELTDEAAERYFLGLINDCLAAIAPRVYDAFHALAVARR